MAAAAVDRLMNMDVERSAIWLTVCMISLSEEVMHRFFAVPVGEVAAASPAEREVAYALDMLEGAIVVGAAR